MKQIFAQLFKVDEERRLIYGRAATEEVDKSGEVFDYESSKPLFQKWSSDIHADTGGRSLGNVRAMHGPVAAGKLTGIDFHDAEKAINVTAKVVDDNEWQKVLEGVYTGFSIGGRYVDKWSDTEAGRTVTRYTAAPAEVSLVDRPCMPSSKYFDVVKRDGSVRRQEFRKIHKPSIVERGGQHVVRDTDGHVYGKHPTRAKAVAQLRALYANKVDELLELMKDFTQSPSATQGITSYRVGDPRRKKMRKGNEDADHEEDNAETPSIRPQPSDAKGGARAKRPAPHPEPEEVDNLDPHVSRGPRGSTSTTKREFSGKERDEAADAGEALPDGSYPIKSKKDLHNAIQAFGRAKDKGKVKAHIKSRAKSLGATSMLPADWGGAKKADGGYTLDDLLEKGVGSVSMLAGICAQLNDWARAYALEQEVEGDDSEVAGEVHGKVAELLELLAECAEEEAEELRETGEDVDTVLLMSDQAEELLKGIETVQELIQKRGARHSRADKALLNKLHDTAVELGADCGAAKVKPVGKREEIEMRVTKGDAAARKGGTAAAITKAVLEALAKGGIESEAPKRGATTGSEVDSEHSSNEERDPEEGTLDGSAGEDNPKSGKREGKTLRGVGKAELAGIVAKAVEAALKAAAADDGEDDDEDEEDEEDGKKKGKKAEKSDDDGDLTKAELVELVASSVAGVLQAVGILEKADGGGRKDGGGNDGGDAMTKIAERARQRPAAFAVDKGGRTQRVGKADGGGAGGDAADVDPLVDALAKVDRVPVVKNDGKVDQPASLIKLIHGHKPTKTVTAESLSSNE